MIFAHKSSRPHKQSRRNPAPMFSAAAKAMRPVYSYRVIWIGGFVRRTFRVFGSI